MRTLTLLLFLAALLFPAPAHGQSVAAPGITLTPESFEDPNVIVVTGYRIVRDIPPREEWGRREGPDRYVDRSGSYEVVTYSRPLVSAGNMTLSGDVRAVDPSEVDRYSAPERTNRVPDLTLRVRF